MICSFRKCLAFILFILLPIVMSKGLLEVIKKCKTGVNLKFLHANLRGYHDLVKCTVS